MKHTVIKLLFIFICFYTCSSQEIKIKKIYLEFKPEMNSTRKQKFYFKKERGTVFNLFCNKNGSLLYKKGADTLSAASISKFKISSFDEIVELQKIWQLENKKALVKKYGKPHPPFDKNGMFETFLIEKICENKYVIYPVIWRNLNVIK
ncbi:MAG: hypothetical protein LCH35_05000 [Bacteroidetes bacterium]|uniref:hypothetical protein n=1 Tax=Flavobacterium sp. TaxID=239 RepID=UPI002FDB8F2A|nr:hypothetical protein [Bacteroidota bacterium]